MHIYFSGVGGAGLSALAQLVDDLGWRVSGSDREASRNTELLTERGLNIFTTQTGKEISRAHQENPIDWLVVSSAIPDGHPETEFADKHSIRTTKRDELTNHIIEESNLKLIAISGTHGKTTTTAMVVWVLKQLEVPISYIIGTNINFGASGAYQRDSEYFVLEADEFDRHMSAYEPYVAIIPSLDYDHADTYPARSDYLQAFNNFLEQSQYTYTWLSVVDRLEVEENTSQLVKQTWSDGIGQAEDASGLFKGVKAFDDVVNPALPYPLGLHNKRNAVLVLEAVSDLLGEDIKQEATKAIMNFPGTERRFEQLAPNVYTDYAHHPAEIRATLELVQEKIAVDGNEQNIVAVYEPHQNVRQHQVKEEYGDCFNKADAVYWLPTYLTREDPNLSTLEPEEITQHLSEATNVIHAEKNQELLDKIKNHHKDGDLIIFMGAGPIDNWLRENLEYLI